MPNETGAADDGPVEMTEERARDRLAQVEGSLSTIGYVLARGVQSRAERRELEGEAGRYLAERSRLRQRFPALANEAQHQPSTSGTSTGGRPS